MITFDGITQPVEEWALDYGITTGIIEGRLNQGWSEREAITTPMVVLEGYRLPDHKREARYEAHGMSLTLSEWSRRTGRTPSCLLRRLKTGIHLDDVFATERRPTKPPSLFIRVGDEMLSAVQLSKRTGLNVETIKSRMRAGWSDEDIATKPPAIGRTRRRG